MEQGAVKKRRGRSKKLATTDLIGKEENESPGESHPHPEHMDATACGRVTRRNPAGRRPLADLQANTGPQARVRKAPAKTTRKRAAAEQQEAAGKEKEDIPSKRSLEVVELEETAPKLKRGKARAAALARKETQRAEEADGNAGRAAGGDAPLRPVREVPGLPSDHKTRLELVRKVFETINAEVEARYKALKASVEAQLATIMAQLRLQQSKFTQEQLKMPLDKFVQQYCPNSTLVQRDDGSYNVVRRETMSMDVTGCAEDGRLWDGGLSESFSQRWPMGASTNVATSEQNIPSAVKWLTRGRVRDKTRDMGEIMSAYIQASVPHDFSVTSPSTVMPAMWRTGNLFGAPPSAVKHPQGYGVTPRTERRPQPGEVLMSINGSPLGQFGQRFGPTP